ncbi:MAG: helix-turn-helix transcriptional regulator [Serratia sp. (in: enterobacteria)]|uniref:helix-turn-helix transcriptional regulator n=1 Tax=Serratia sp. (in: enterobacteria) TaxID=616 RepID=UPI003F3DCE62
MVSDLCDEEHDAAYGADWLVWLQPLRGDKPLVVITEELPEPPLRVLSQHSAISVLALQTPRVELGQQLYQILAGKQVISPLLSPLSTVAAPPLKRERLTEAELQVFALLHAGYSVTQIASRLHRSVKTVSTHKRHLMYKLRVDNEIALFARVKNLNETTCCLDNGQQFVKHPHPGAP